MTDCEACGADVPADSGQLLCWLIEQEIRRYEDELVFGSAFACSTCGSRLNPMDCYAVSH